MVLKNPYLLIRVISLALYLILSIQGWSRIILSKHKNIALLFLILLSPLLFLLSNHEWMYPNPHNPDAFINHVYSYFYDIPNYRHFWYKSERTSWLVPLFYLKQLIGGINLAPFLALASWISLGSLFYIFFRNLYSPRKSLFFLPWVMYFPHLVGNSSGGGTYHNYGTSIYFLLCLIFWERAFAKNKKIFFIISGIFLCSTITSSIIHLNLLLLLPILQYQLKEKFSFSHYLYLLIGIILALILWGGFSFYFDRGFLNFGRRFDILFRHINQYEEYQEWFYPLKSFFFLKKRFATYLSFLAICFVVNLIYLKNKFKEKKPFGSYSINVHAVFIICLWVLWHIQGTNTLYPPDFVYPLQVPLLWSIANTLPEPRYRYFRPITLITLGLLITSALSYFPFNHASKIPDPIYVGIFTTIGIIGVLILISRAPYRGLTRAGAIVAVILCFDAFNDKVMYINKNPCLYHKESHDLVFKIVDTALKYRKKPEQIFFYFDEGETLKLTNPICSLYPKLPLGKIAEHIRMIIDDTHDQLKLVDRIKNADFYYLKKKKTIFLILGEKTDFFAKELQEKAKRYNFKLQTLIYDEMYLSKEPVRYALYALEDKAQDKDE